MSSHRIMDSHATQREYEDSYLMFKDMSRRSVSIGDFYGDAEFALIDRNERFVVMTDSANQKVIKRT